MLYIYTYIYTYPTLCFATSDGNARKKQETTNKKKKQRGET